MAAELTKAPPDQEPILQILVEASKKYDEYLRLAETSELTRETGLVQRPKRADWTHPLGLVFYK